MEFNSGEIDLLREFKIAYLTNDPSYEIFKKCPSWGWGLIK